jgi:hypothetical protein
MDFALSKSRKPNNQCAQPQGHIPQELTTYVSVVYFTPFQTKLYTHTYKVFTLNHGNIFRLYIQPSSGLKEISPGTKSVYCVEFHIVLQIFLKQCIN